MNQSLFPHENDPEKLVFERLARREGFCLIAGVDEAGRGPLAGPVVAAAVILPPEPDLPGVNDSKQLTERRREDFFHLIMERAVAVGVGISSHDVIDRINILQASLLAMKKAISKLSIRPDYVLVDGTFKVPVRLPQRTIVKGDSLSLSVASASIIAKVTRDRMMCSLEAKYPGYGFAGHKGYACRSHLNAIAALGPSAVHRKTFSGVKEHLQDRGEGVRSFFPEEQ
jgi:ribonuclease HII